MFPEMTLNACGFLLVFASGLDRTNDVNFLHTNFKLFADGEYLGLIYSDETNIIDEIAPSFPSLQADESYGIPMKRTDTFLLGHDASVKVLIPHNDALGDTWKNELFDDSGWIQGTMAVGYERGSDYTPLINTDVTAMYNVMESCYIRSYFLVTNISEILSVKLNVSYDDGCRFY